MFNKFLLDKHLNDVYDVEGYTTSEVLCKFYEKIRELITEFNRVEINNEEFKKVVSEKLEFLLGEGLANEVAERLNELYENGELGSLINDVLLSDINNKVTKVYNDFMYFKTLNIEREVLTKYSLDESIIKNKYPYCHINRYGGDPSGNNDSSLALQIAVDVLEKFGNSTENYDSFQVLIGKGYYKITKPILIKQSETYCNYNVPISITGVNLNLKAMKGYCMSFLDVSINNFNGRDYSSLFTINNQFEDVLNPVADKDKMVFTSGNTSASGVVIRPIMNCIEIKNICGRDNYNNCYFIKGYRFRSNIDNIYLNGFKEAVYQPPSDSSNYDSYCDFSSFTNINCENMDHAIMTLCNSDNSVIEKITNHRPSSSFEYLIRINGGSDINIKSILSSYFFLPNTTIPVNRGSGENGTKAYILLVNAKSIKISGMHVERTMLDYLVRCYNCQNITIENTNELFLCNGFVKLQSCDGVRINNCRRNGNLINEYKDLVSENSKNVTLKNVICKDRYNESFSISTDYSSATMTPYSDATSPYRYLKEVGLNYNNERDKYTVLVMYNNGWILRNKNNEDLSDYFEIENTNNILRLKFKNPTAKLYIESINPIINSAAPTQYPYRTARDTSSLDKFVFLGNSNAIITEFNGYCRCEIVISTSNKYLLP